MSDWLFNLPIVWMSAIILGAVYGVTAIIYLLVTRLAVGDRARAFKAISPGMLSPLAVIFALLVGFLAAQVWRDAEAASASVNREASALRSLVLLAGEFPGEPEGQVDSLVRSYIREAVDQEWPAMASGSATLTIAPAALVAALRLTLALDPATPGQLAAQREMLGSIEGALEARRQRIILSKSSINGVKWSVLLLQAGLTLLAIGMVHSDIPGTNRIIMGIFATGIGVAVILIAAHSRPFTGAISVRPAYLLQVMPEAGPAPASP